MKTFAQLGTVHRGEPCQEYPGEWLVYSKGEERGSFPNRGLAIAYGEELVKEYDKQPQEIPIQVSVSWKASDNDPRIGQVWFTGFYQDGKFNQFGSYVSS
jgi:hypothetical protein